MWLCAWVSPAEGIAYNTPILMATITPAFSLRFMVKDQIIFQGRIAKTMSMAPE